VVQAARKHLAERLDVSPAEVTVIEVEETYWEDETLGCPRPPGQYPDRAYPQLIPGYRVVLQVGGTRYEYHSGLLWLIYCGTIPG
jgi:hypothetical protein